MLIQTVWFKTLKIIFAQPMLQYTNTCNQEKFHNAPSQMRTLQWEHKSEFWMPQNRDQAVSESSNSFFTKDFTDITSYEPSCSLAPSTFEHTFITLWMLPSRFALPSICSDSWFCEGGNKSNKPTPGTSVSSVKSIQFWLSLISHLWVKVSTNGLFLHVDCLFHVENYL